MASNRIGWLLSRVLAGAISVPFGLPPALAKNAADLSATNAPAGLLQSAVLSQSTTSARQNAGATSPFLKASPDIFEATGLASWDGKRTLQGIWVAHPLATSARRVRIFNDENGLAVDGALFKRDSSLSGTSVLISSEAANLLQMGVDQPTKLRIVAVTPARRDRSQDRTAEQSENNDAGADGGAERPEAGVADSSTKAFADQTEVATPIDQPAAETIQGTAAVAEADASEDSADLADSPTVEASTPDPEQQTAAISVSDAAQTEPTTADTVANGGLPVPTPRPDQQTVGALSNPLANGSTDSLPVLDPKTGPIVLTEPDLAASQPDRASARLLRTQPDEVEVTGAEDKPAIEPAPLRRSAPKETETTVPEASSSQPEQPASSLEPTKEKEPKETVVTQSSPLTQPFVQAGIFGVQQNAEKLLRRLRAADLPALGKPFRSGGKPLTRVLAGPFQNKRDRDAAQEVIRRMGLKDAVPVRK